MEMEEKLKESYIAVRGKIGKIIDVQSHMGFCNKKVYVCKTKMEDGEILNVTNDYYRIYFNAKKDDEFYKMRCISGYIAVFFEYDENTAYGYPECKVEKIGNTYRITGDIPFYCDVYTEKKYSNVEDFVEWDEYEKELIVPIEIAQSPYKEFMEWMGKYRLEKQKEIRRSFTEYNLATEYQIERAQIKLQHYKDPQWIQNEIQRLEKYISDSEKEVENKLTKFEEENTQDSVKNMKVRGLQWKKFGYESTIEKFQNDQMTDYIKELKEKRNKTIDNIRELQSS